MEKAKAKPTHPAPVFEFSALVKRLRGFAADGVVAMVEHRGEPGAAWVAAEAADALEEAHTIIRDFAFRNPAWLDAMAVRHDPLGAHAWLAKYGAPPPAGEKG